MYGLEIKSERTINNPIIPNVVMSPPIFSFLRAIDNYRTNREKDKRDNISIAQIF